MFCPNMMKKLGFGTRFYSIPVYIDNTSASYVAGSQSHSPRVQHVALWIFFTQKLVEEGIISTHYGQTEDHLADISSKHLSKQRHRCLIKLIYDFKA